MPPVLPLVEPEPLVELEPPAEPAPPVEAPPPVEPEPLVEPPIEPEPLVEPDASMEPEPLVEPEASIDPDPLIEPVESELMVDSVVDVSVPPPSVVVEVLLSQAPSRPVPSSIAANNKEGFLLNMTLKD